MLKNRLYYAEPTCKSFTSSVVKSGINEHDQFYVVLENTAFYPTGGG